MTPIRTLAVALLLSTALAGSALAQGCSQTRGSLD